MVIGILYILQVFLVLNPYPHIDYADNQLTIKSDLDKDEKDDKSKTVHRGISKRQFTKRFTLADEVEVKSAELKDGMLIVELEKIVPEAKKPRTIKIK